MSLKCGKKYCEKTIQNNLKKDDYRKCFRLLNGMKKRDHIL